MIQCGDHFFQDINNNVIEKYFQNTYFEPSKLKFVL